MPWSRLFILFLIWRGNSPLISRFGGYSPCSIVSGFARYCAVALVIGYRGIPNCNEMETNP